jgi:hypothetical protein
MPMSREAREELTRRQAALSGLTKNPNWPEYVAEHHREIARIEKRMLQEVKGPGAVDQRAIDFWRGCLFILRWQIAMPIGAERKLITYLRSQGVEIEEEEEMIDV